MSNEYEAMREAYEADWQWEVSEGTTKLGFAEYCEHRREADAMECPRCSEIELREIGEVHDHAARMIGTEYECDSCGHFEMDWRRDLQLVVSA